MSTDVYAVITERIIAKLEAGTVPWRMPWDPAVGSPRNLVSGKAYRGINVLLLGCSGYTSPWWLTFRQALDLGGNVRKGEKGTPIVFWTTYEDKKDSTKKRFVLRYFTVFNVAQCDGIDVPVTEPRDKHQPIEECEHLAFCYFNGPKAPKLSHGSAQACYRPSSDTIAMPDRDTFHHVEEYYSTLFHEMTHSTGHESRLARKLSGASMMSSSYAKEELIAASDARC